MTNIKLNSNIILDTSNIDFVGKIIKQNTFENPAYISNAENHRSNWQTAPTIITYHREGESLILPRGYMRDLIKLFHDNNITPNIIDERSSQPCSYPETLQGITLRPYQKRAVDEAMKYDQGVLISPTGSGKSLIGLEIIRQRKQKTLIIVHRSELAKQWIDVIKERLGLTAGFIGDGHWEIGNEITVALMQSLSARANETKALSNVFGLLVHDEIHHVPAQTFFDVISLLAAKFRYALSATINRRDGLEPMIYRAIGPAIATITRQEVEDMGATVPAIVFAISTNFNPGLVNSWHEYLDSLTINTERNLLILSLAQARLEKKGAVLILVDRVAHSEQLSEMLTRRNVDHVIAHGKIKDRENLMEKIKSSKLTIGTTSLLGEGIDVSVWSTLILAAPISSEIKLLQAIGRIVRPCADGKENALVYDLKDDCGFAGASFNKRFAIYKKNKIWVEFEKKKNAA